MGFWFRIDSQGAAPHTGSVTGASLEISHISTDQAQLLGLEELRGLRCIVHQYNSEHTKPCTHFFPSVDQYVNTGLSVKYQTFCPSQSQFYLEHDIC